ncbi:MAG: hypothetical protein SX243_11145 [Acidobacteriota bacterium]|nr:hypothetical protein [Acidobacteriota bacterium]
MFQMIGYDFSRPRKVSNLEEFLRAKCGDGVNLLNGPWLLDATQLPAQVLNNLRGHLAAVEQDDYKLIVTRIHMGEIGTGRSNVAQPLVTKKGNRVLAVAYTLRQPPTPKERDFELGKKDPAYLEAVKVHKKKMAAYKARYDRLLRTMKSFDDACSPVEALWFVSTNQTARDLHIQIESTARLSPSDELFVSEVNTSSTGAEAGLETADHNWLLDHHVIH